ncbi:hypothetical protein RRG08_015919 [Elysia crispata]|uniref:Uncharacterized protein n=1 Tax=Elysia crispata TaxID=231223 RepID=A0AAE1AMS7_9GAST|nr:hypothetical protein RRG08_015919 [Elysia crispata]
MIILRTSPHQDGEAPPPLPLDVCVLLNDRLLALAPGEPRGSPALVRCGGAEIPKTSVCDVKLEKAVGSECRNLSICFLRKHNDR